MSKEESPRPAIWHVDEAPELPEGVLRGIEDIAEGRTAGAEELAEAREY